MSTRFWYAETGEPVPDGVPLEIGVEYWVAFPGTDEEYVRMIAAASDDNGGALVPDAAP